MLTMEGRKKWWWWCSVRSACELHKTFGGGVGREGVGVGVGGVGGGGGGDGRGGGGGGAVPSWARQQDSITDALLNISFLLLRLSPLVDSLSRLHHLILPLYDVSVIYSTKNTVTVSHVEERWCIVIDNTGESPLYHQAMFCSTSSSWKLWWRQS